MNMLFDPTSNGYEIYRQYIHRNCLTGLIHGIMMPFSALGLWLLVFSFIKFVLGYPRHRAIDYTLSFIKCTTLIWTFGMMYDPYYGIFTGLFYYITGYLYISFITAQGHSNENLFFRGLFGMIVSVGCMEFLGHWFLEGYGSDLSQVINSIFHTPIYGMRSIVEYTLGTGACKLS